MSNDVVIHFTKCSSKTTLASAKIATFLSDVIGANLVDTKQGKPYIADRLFLVNSPFQFCDFRDDVYQYVSMAKKYIGLRMIIY